MGKMKGQQLEGRGQAKELGGEGPNGVCKGSAGSGRAQSWTASVRRHPTAWEQQAGWGTLYSDWHSLGGSVQSQCLSHM